METAISIIGGLITLVGIAFPVFIKVKKHYDKDSKKVDTADDNSKRNVFINRMRDRSKS